MPGKRLTRCLFALCFTLLAVVADPLGAATGARETLTIGGTGAALGGMKLLSAAYMAEHPEVDVVVLPSLGSGGGINAVLSGAIDLAVSARRPKEGERARGALSELYASTALAVVTARGTQVSAITTEELAAIYAGVILTWRDGTPIRLVMRPANESDTELLASLSPALADAVALALTRPGMLIEATDQANADTLERLPGGVGLVSLAQILSERRALRPITLDGLAPTVAAVARGNYPLVKELLLVTGPAPSQRARSFVTFLRSAKGQAILEASGHLPINPAPSAA